MRNYNCVVVDGSSRRKAEFEIGTLIVWIAKTKFWILLAPTAREAPGTGPAKRNGQSRRRKRAEPPEDDPPQPGKPVRDNARRAEGARRGTRPKEGATQAQEGGRKWPRRPLPSSGPTTAR
jgi:hypothetical protein